MSAQLPCTNCHLIILTLVPFRKDYLRLMNINLYYTTIIATQHMHTVWKISFLRVGFPRRNSLWINIYCNAFKLKQILSWPAQTPSTPKWRGMSLGLGGQWPLSFQQPFPISPALSLGPPHDIRISRPSSRQAGGTSQRPAADLSRNCHAKLQNQTSHFFLTILQAMPLPQINEPLLCACRVPCIPKWDSCAKGSWLVHSFAT